jgi:hypothetical protein
MKWTQKEKEEEFCKKQSESQDCHEVLNEEWSMFFLTLSW